MTRHSPMAVILAGYLMMYPVPIVAVVGAALGAAHWVNRSNAVLLSVVVDCAAIAWGWGACLVWRRWVSGMNGVDRKAVERLARRTGLLRRSGSIAPRRGSR